MNAFADRNRLKLYLWMALAYTLLWALNSSTIYTGRFFTLLLNNAWRTAYVAVLGFIFFEYTVPYVLKKRKYVVYNILIGIFLLWVHMMFWSFGLYAWRLVGVGIGIYTSLAAFKSTEEALQGQMAFSMGSVFFFGIIRHIYLYQKLKALL